MVLPAKLRSKKAYLLAEALLSVLLITVGLVGITRGLSSQLRAFDAMQEQNHLLSLAQTFLRRLEILNVNGVLAQEITETSGVFDKPDDAYQWSIDAEMIEATQGEPTPLARVNVRVQRATAAGETRKATLSAVWPAERVPPQWF